LSVEENGTAEEEGGTVLAPPAPVAVPVLVVVVVVVVVALTMR
jgi:hypothetical protein